MRRRTTLTIALLALSLPALLGMGTGGGSPLSDTIPRPKDNFRAELTDRQSVATRLELLSCNGKTFFPLERGEGTLMVPFDRVQRVDVGEDEGNRVKVSLVVDGGALEGALSRVLLCTGMTEYGNYQIEVRGLRTIRFQKP